MDDADDLDRTGFPGVDNNVRVKIPKAIFSTEQFIVIVADPRGSSQRLESILQSLAQSVGSIRTVFGEVQENIAKVSLCRWGKDEGLPH
jgi:hypothetical protein